MHRGAVRIRAHLPRVFAPGLPAESCSLEQDVPWRDAQLFQPAVRRNIKLAECPSFGKTIFDYEPNCAGARDYKALAQAVAAQKISD